jgi:hypothetical protein
MICPLGRHKANFVTRSQGRKSRRLAQDQVLLLESLHRALETLSLGLLSLANCQSFG